MSENKIVVGGETITINGEPVEDCLRHSPDYYEWKPKEDITTYELSKCFPIVTAMQCTTSLAHRWRETIENLPENCQRHFEIV